MSDKSKTIQIRVTPEQRERIKNKAQAKGYASVSSFLLHLALEKDLLFEQRFDELYHVITRKSSALDKKTHSA